MRARNKEADIKWQEKTIVTLLVTAAKHRAKAKELEFNIDATDLTIPELCPILKVPIVVVRGKGRRPDGPYIDRKDSSKGYIKGNVWIISALANRMKQNATIEQLKKFGEWAQKLKETDAGSD